jgi:uncharacterized membrane protein
MAKDVGDLIGTAIGRVARETMQTVASNHKRGGGPSLSGGKGLAAGAGLASLAPLAYKGAKGAKNLMSGSGSGSGPIEKAKGKLEGNVKDKAKEGAKDALPFGGGGKKNEEAGVGKGRRMPIQQAMEIGAPLETVYNEWTQFEEWPSFMHRLESVSQEDETHLTFKAKIWGKSKEFKAEIEEQVPDERIKWKVSEGMTHTGVVTFSELAPNLTHVELNMDVQPGSLVEKAARGMRHIKRAVRADLHRFKAHVMMNQEESGAWRGTIDDGEVKSTASRSASASSRSRSRSSGSSGSSGSSRKRSSSGSSAKSSNAKSSNAKSSNAKSSNGSSASSSRSRKSPAKSSSASKPSAKSRSSANGSKSSASKPSAKSRSSSSNGRSSSSRKKTGARS